VFALFGNSGSGTRITDPDKEVGTRQSLKASLNSPQPPGIDTTKKIAIRFIVCNESCEIKLITPFNHGPQNP